MNEHPRNQFGYAEMYEWADIPKDTSLYGKVVQFNEEYPYTVQLAKDTNRIVGISTLNSIIESDNANYWPPTYLFDSYGDIYLNEKNIAIGKKEYDDVNEMSYIKTEKETIYVPLVNENYDSTQQYVSRLKRKEWACINILGKCIVEDNGKCEGGKYATLYSGNDESRYGTVVPAKKDSAYKLYVLNRVSDKTILVFNKPV